MEHAWRLACISRVCARVAHDEQAPVQVIVDGHKKEVLLENVQGLQAVHQSVAEAMNPPIV